MSIAILYEHAGTDEMGIKLTAEEQGIDLAYIPFRKISFSIERGTYHIRSKRKDYSKTVENATVVLNRAQGRNRRLLAASVFEELGKHVINPQEIEYICFSKLRTLLRFWKEGIPMPKSVYIPCDPQEKTKSGDKINNEEDIADLIQRELGNGPTVVKPDAGTHGKEVQLTKKREELLETLRRTSPSIINPVGVLAQEMVHKWFYDLRIVVAKEKGKSPYCYPKALARAGFKDFRTNAHLGNMVFGVNLPLRLRELAVKCAEAVGRRCEAWILALDAMVNVCEDKTADDEYVKTELEKLVPLFDEIQKVKRQKEKRKNFSAWNKGLEEAFQKYMGSDAYENVRKIIERSVEIKENDVLFHEANSCPDFWEQTRLVAKIDLATQLLKCAQSFSEPK